MTYCNAFLSACLWLGLAAAALPGAPDQQPIPGIGPVRDVVKVHGGFEFTEGPASDEDGNLYFCDIPNDRIHKVAADGTLSIFLEPSHRTNGLMLDATGKLIACQTKNGRLVSIDVDTKEITPFAETYNGKRFNALNDLVIDRNGGVYFTDPRYGAPNPWPQGIEAVYYRAPDGKVTRLIDDLLLPNGVILSPDETTLYVVPGSNEVMAYTLPEPGKVENGRPFYTLGGGGDGLTVDTNGNLYISSSLGIQVVSPDGSQLGIIKTPEKPCNVTFGGKDMRTLFVTAQKSLYSAEMEATGHRFAKPSH